MPAQATNLSEIGTSDALVSCLQMRYCFDEYWQFQSCMAKASKAGEDGESKCLPMYKNLMALCPNEWVIRIAILTSRAFRCHVAATKRLCRSISRITLALVPSFKIQCAL